MRHLHFTLSLLSMSLVLMTACSAVPEATLAPTTPTEEEISLSPTEAEPAVTVEDTATPAPTLTSAPSPVPTVTNTRVATTTPTLAPTPEPVVQVNETLTARVNVRSGPGTNYPVIAQFEPGQAAVVTGRNGDDSWWQIRLEDVAAANSSVGWLYGELATFSGDSGAVPVAVAPPPPPTSTPAAQDVADQNDQAEAAPEDLAGELRCGQDFCVTFQAMVPIWENGGCVGNHSIYITVLEGLPPGKPLDGIVIGDTFDNVEVASGSHGPGRTEITLWNNSMTLLAKRHINGTPFTSEESFNFTAHDELIPADVLAANGYCDGNVEECRRRQQVNQICRGHYSWRVTFHKFD